jgi:hypothetical protein
MTAVVAGAVTTGLVISTGAVNSSEAVSSGTGFVVSMEAVSSEAGLVISTEDISAGNSSGVISSEAGFAISTGGVSAPRGRLCSRAGGGARLGGEAAAGGRGAPGEVPPEKSHQGRALAQPDKKKAGITEKRTAAIRTGFFKISMRAGAIISKFPTTAFPYINITLPAWMVNSKCRILEFP